MLTLAIFVFIYLGLNRLFSGGLGVEPHSSTEVVLVRAGALMAIWGLWRALAHGYRTYAYYRRRREERERTERASDDPPPGGTGPGGMDGIR